MVRKIASQSAVWLLIGLVLGLGLSFVLGGNPTFATATDHQDDFALATGLINGSLEAVYLLDFKTGDLLGTVMNQQNGEFQNVYRRNLQKDFALNQRQKGKYIMVTGLFESVRGTQVPINHVLYVAELNSGRLGAYYMPYRGQQARGTATDELLPIQIIPFRSGTPLRQQ